MKVSRFNTLTTLHLCHKPTGAVIAPCGLVVKSVLYMHYANERTVTWSSFMAICRSACDRSRSCQLSSLWDVAVMNSSSPRYRHVQRFLTRSVTALLHSCRGETFISTQSKRQGWVSQSILRLIWRISHFIKVHSTWGNYSENLVPCKDLCKMFSNNFLIL